MKKMNCLWAGLAALAWAGCSEPVVENYGEDPNGETVSFKVSAPELAMQSRAAREGTNSARGGLTNVDWTQYDLRYQLAVYDAEGEELLMDAKVKTFDGVEDAVFDLRLTPGHEYTFVAWADIVKQGSEADLHYNTTDLQKVTILDKPDAQLNDESRDAYFKTQKMSVNKGESFSGELVLRRPFAKLRVVATDWDLMNWNPKYVEVAYHGCTRFEGINAVSGEAIAADGNTEGTTVDGSTVYTAEIPADAYAEGYDADPNNRTLMVDYLAMNPEQQAIHFTFDIQRESGESIIEHDFVTNIPVERNHLTTILGNLLTTDGRITISIEENFDESEYEVMENWNGGKFNPIEPVVENGVYQITSANELYWLAKNDDKKSDPNIPGKTNAWKVKKVALTQDIDLTGLNWEPIDIFDETFEFDGNGHAIRNLKINYNELSGDQIAEGDTYWGNRMGFGLFGRVIMKEIRNVTLENVTFEGIRGSELPYPGDGEGDVEPNTDETQQFGALVGSLDGGKVTNCHAYHVFMKGDNSLGGLIGYVREENNNVVIEGCSVDDVTLVVEEHNYSCGGGLIGYFAGRPTGIERVVTNCETSNVLIYGSFDTKGYSGLIGQIGGKDRDRDGGEDFAPVTLKGCSAGEVTYLDAEGRVVDYEPVHTLFGSVVQLGNPLVPLDYENYVTIE